MESNFEKERNLLARLEVLRLTGKLGDGKEHLLLQQQRKLVHALKQQEVG